MEDGRAALEAGADMLGFIFYRPVARYVQPEQVRDVVRELRRQFSGWQAVGVFVDEPDINAIADRCDLDLLQLAGDEPPEVCLGLERPAIKVLRVRQGRWDADRLQTAKAGYDVARFMVDSHVSGFYGGTGVASDWGRLAGLMEDHILAGGLRPNNVAQALAITRPWGVDVSTGVETTGRKDPKLVRQFVHAVRAYDRQLV
ncbi:MAG TPA: phosphoribosylanthranilate isomerase, partial [Chloroflexota bacterium]